MNLIWKTVYFLRKEGLINTLRRILARVADMVRHVPLMVVEAVYTKKYAGEIQKKAAGKNVYILLPCFEWNLPLFQRPHQLALALAERKNAYVLFVSDEYHYDNFAGIMPVNGKLDVVSRRIAGRIGEALRAAECVIAIKCWPMQSELLASIPYDKLVYEYIDDLSLLPHCTQAILDEHIRLMACADLTVCTAQKLYEDALPHGRQVLYSPNGGDYAFFHGNRGCPVEPRLAEQIKGYHCVIGYYGSISRWFDYDLVIRVAEERPDWCFVLVGSCSDGTISRLHQRKRKNILLFPAQPYGRLPSFVSAFDIQAIPFVINEITTATSPVKLFEYMASGKPILTSAMPECMRYHSATVYSGAEDFMAKVPELMESGRDPAYLEAMDKEARANTWEARVEELLENLAERVETL